MSKKSDEEHHIAHVRNRLFNLIRTIMWSVNAASPWQQNNGNKRCKVNKYKKHREFLSTQKAEIQTRMSPPVYFLLVGYLSQFLGTVPNLCPGTTSLGDSSGPPSCLATPGMDNAAWPRLPLLSKKEVAERNCSQYTSGYLQLPPEKKGGDFEQVFPLRCWVGQIHFENKRI